MWRVGSKIPINVYDGDRPVCQCQTAVDARNIVAAMNVAPVAVTVCRRLVALDPPSPYTASGTAIAAARNEWFSLFEVAQQVTRDVKYGKDIRLAFGATRDLPELREQEAAITERLKGPMNNLGRALEVADRTAIRRMIAMLESSPDAYESAARDTTLPEVKGSDNA